MLEKLLQDRIIRSLPFVPNTQQEGLVEALSRFLVCRDDKPAFLLRGYAGTGKTSVMAALVKAMQSLNQPVVLLAPTGRAAKVLARYAGVSAFTIHRRIYRQNRLGEEAFSLQDNLQRNTLFIVDEASMLSGVRDNPSFGSGNLLDDLVTFVYSGVGCRLLLLGDNAQLPPVGSSQSPALDASYLQGYGLTVYAYTLTVVARQALDSGILRNATRLRECIAGGRTNFEWESCEDVHVVKGQVFVEALEESYREAGQTETLLLTRTNRRTNLYNQGIRARILYKEDALSTDDRLMVSRNNYFFTEQYEHLPFLANGDMLQIVRFRNERELYGFHFVDASVRVVDYDWEIDVVLWLDTLTTDSPEANYALHKELFGRIAEDYPEYACNKRKLTEAVFESPYYNALQVRFAYAVTCHKAQGGQWERVFIDPGNRPEDESEAAYYRWLYTAVTRATKQVYILSPLEPKHS